MNLVSRTQDKNPAYFASRIAELAAKATLLGEKDVFSERDVAQADEYNQQYIDILQEILDFRLTIKTEVVVRLENDTIRFHNADAFSDWLTEHV